MFSNPVRSSNPTLPPLPVPALRSTNADDVASA
jgi:hypothetical protein